MFESLDFVYIPPPVIESSVDYYVRSLGSVLKKSDIVLIYNVSNLEKTVFQLLSMGWEEENKLEIPPGPCCTFP